MSIRSIQPLTIADQAQSIGSPSNTATSSADAAADLSGVSVEVSRPASLLSELDALAKSDPDKFKAVTASISNQLKDAAASATGSQADFLKKLADRFDKASQSGNPSDLAPQGAQGHGGHHGHHKMHAAAMAAAGDPTSSASSASPATTPQSVASIVEGIISKALG